MTVFKAIILGIIQGATEFLPVSSSGHLVLFESLFGIKEGALTFNVFLHFGTLIAIIIVFWNDIKSIILFKKSHRHLTTMILLGIIPTGIIGVLFKDIFEQLFGSVLLVGFMLLFTGGILYYSANFKEGNNDMEAIKPTDALTIGFIQGLAIIPGISRSGSTIVGGMFRGLRRDKAAEFSLLVSLPVILGATLLEAKDILQGAGGDVVISHVVAGTLAALISGYLAIRFLLRLLRERTLKPFAYYCWALGLLVILSQFF